MGRGGGVPPAARDILDLHRRHLIPKPIVPLVFDGGLRPLFWGGGGWGTVVFFGVHFLGELSLGPPAPPSPPGGGGPPLPLFFPPRGARNETSVTLTFMALLAFGRGDGSPSLQFLASPPGDAVRRSIPQKQEMHSNVPNPTKIKIINTRMKNNNNNNNTSSNTRIPILKKNTPFQGDFISSDSFPWGRQ